ncbi:MAG: hypothetical protein M3Q71_22005 [Chloroflexota bacterium]|nr:hypothetical protein [Chloroflexota bacterium]
MERRLDSMQAAATHLLDTLMAGRDVTLEITARDEETGGLVRLITELHEVAQARRLGVTLAPMGERGLRLTLVEPSQTGTEGRLTTRRG